MNRILLVLGLLIGSIALVDSAGAIPPPASCTFDPGIGGVGQVTIELPDEGYQLERMAFDAQGRLYVIADNEIDGMFSDRMWRFLSDGSVDQSWGTNGRVDLPGRTVSSNGRVLAVDDLGRVWVVRNTLLHVREVLRFTATGDLDSSLPEIRWNAGDSASFGPVGAIAVEGDGVVVAHATTLQSGTDAIDFVRISSVGALSDFSSEQPGSGGFFVLSVASNGYVGGQVSQGGEPYPFLWNGGQGATATFYISDQAGSVTSIAGTDPVFVVGQRFNGRSATEAPGFGMEFSAEEPLWFFDETMRDGTEEVDTGLPGEFVMPLAVYDDGTVIGLTGFDDSSQFAFVAQMEPGGALSIDSPRLLVGSQFYPAASRIDIAGRHLLAGYAGEDAELVFMLGLTPDLGPAVAEGVLGDQISRLYEAYFLRESDAAGLAFWRDERVGGRSLSSISDQFATSPEFVDLYGEVSDSQFVALLYRNVLGRDFETEGLSFWRQQLLDGLRTRGSVMLEFSESAENIERTGTSPAHDAETGQVYRLYKAYFDRAPDAGGSCFWVRRLVAGASLDEVSDSFAGSQEFVKTYGSLSNREFVELVYSNVLGRPGEAFGVDFWTGELDASRRTRGQVMTGFSESPEYVERTGTLPGDSLS